MRSQSPQTVSPSRSPYHLSPSKAPKNMDSCPTQVQIQVTQVRKYGALLATTAKPTAPCACA